jgi:hypothetical protein
MGFLFKLSVSIVGDVCQIKCSSSKICRLLVESGDRMRNEAVDVLYC